MQYPPKRDRLIEYRAFWNSSPRTEDFVLGQLIVTQDRIDPKKEIEVTAHIDAKSSRFPIWKSDDFLRRLESLHVVIRPECIRFLNRLDTTHNVLTLGTSGLHIDSPKDVVRYINRFAAAFHNPPVSSMKLKKYILRRDVRVKFMNNKLRWMDEGEWLAASVALEVQQALEEEFVQAWVAMHKEGQAIRITLRHSLDSRSAATLNDTYGVAFVFSQEDRNKLRAVGEEGYKPQPITITLEYRTPPSGVRQLARILAPYIESVEEVSVEVNRG